MNKVLIVGHQNSHYRILEEILQMYGMSASLNSYTHNMTPQQITAKLLKASSAKPKKSIYCTSENYSTIVAKKQDYKFDGHFYVQKHPKKMWENLSFDLLIANVDQPLWGWSDDKALELLEYWANFDEDMAFILNYDKPDSVLQQILQSCDLKKLEKSFIQSQLQDWSNYNKALLSFYKKNPDRCMLVNGEQVVNSSKEYIKFVAKKVALQVEPLNSRNVILTDSTKDLKSVNQEPVVDFIIEQVLKRQDSVNGVFDKLQQEADIPLVLDNQTHDPLTILKKIALQQKELSETKHKKQQAQCELDTTRQQLIACEQENLHMVKHLHQVQEELERYYLANQKSQKQLKSVHHAVTVAKQETELQKDQVIQLKKNKQKFYEIIKSYQIDSEQTKTELTKIQDDLNKKQIKLKYLDITQKENALLLTQLYQVQEQLEKYYLENQRLKEYKKMNNNSAQPVYYGAADRIKQDLPYRLGSKMVKHSKSPKELATLPLALFKEYRQFTSVDSKSKLPDLKEFKDADEAEKVKKHLSYRLGKVLVDSIYSPKEFVRLPVKLSKELVDFKRK